MSMIFGFILTLTLTSIGCEDWCSLIKPNGTYEGLGIYRTFSVSGTSSFVMYNRVGSEWMFNVIESGGQFYLKMIENTTTKVTNNENVIHRYGFYLSSLSQTSQSFQLTGSLTAAVVDCKVTTAKSGSEFTNECVFNKDPNKSIVDKSAKFYPSFVIFKASTDQSIEAMGGAQFFVLDKQNKNNRFRYEPFVTGKERFGNCSEVDICDKLSFVKQMDDSIFAKIDGIVHISNGSKSGSSGHLILFNINDSPKYCFVPLIDSFADTYSAKNCKSAEDMKALFEECLPPSVDSTQHQDVNPGANPMTTTVLDVVQSSAKRQTISLFIFLFIFAFI